MTSQSDHTGPQAGYKGCSNCAHRGSTGWATNGACRTCKGYHRGYPNWKADPKTLAGYIEAIQIEEKVSDECHLGDIKGTQPSIKLNVTPVPHDVVHNPSHYTEGRTIEPIHAIMDWELNFCLGNVVKYISRAGRKNSALEDLKKARFYLDAYITSLEGGPDYPRN